MTKSTALLALILTATALQIAPARADDTAINIVAKDGVYTPSEINVPADQKVKLHVKNEDSAMVEFESYPLNREVRIQPGEEKDIYIDAQKPGTYAFFDDNNPDAKGTLIVK